MRNKLLLPVILLVLMGCGNDLKNKTLLELNKLPNAEVEKFMQSLSEEEQGILFLAAVGCGFSGLGGASNVSDICNMTVKQVLKEGKQELQQNKN